MAWKNEEEVWKRVTSIENDKLPVVFNKKADRQNGSWEYDICVCEGEMFLESGVDTGTESVGTIVTLNPEMLAEVMRYIGWTCTKD